MFFKPNNHTEVLMRLASVEQALHGMFDAGLMTCLAHPNDDVAAEILESLRAVFHGPTGSGEALLYSESYLEHLDRVISVAQRLGRASALANLLSIKRYLTDNSGALAGALSAVRQVEEQEAMRQNYYLN